MVAGRGHDEQALGEPHDILRAFAQGRHAQRDHVEAIEQILAKPVSRDFGGQVAIGSGDDAGVHRDSVVAADALEALFLHEAEELGLQGRTQVSDLVEEDSAAMRRLESSGLVLDRAGEGTRACVRTTRFLADARRGWCN